MCASAGAGAVAGGGAAAGAAAGVDSGCCTGGAGAAAITEPAAVSATAGAGADAARAGASGAADSGARAGSGSSSGSSSGSGSACACGCGCGSGSGLSAGAAACSCSCSCRTACSGAGLGTSCGGSTDSVAVAVAMSVVGRRSRAGAWSDAAGAGWSGGELSAGWAEPLLGLAAVVGTGAAAGCSCCSGGRKATKPPGKVPWRARSRLSPTNHSSSSSSLSSSASSSALGARARTRSVSPLANVRSPRWGLLYLTAATARSGRPSSDAGIVWWWWWWWWVQTAWAVARVPRPAPARGAGHARHGASVVCCAAARTPARARSSQLGAGAWAGST